MLPLEITGLKPCRGGLRFFRAHRKFAAPYGAMRRSKLHYTLHGKYTVMQELHGNRITLCTNHTTCTCACDRSRHQSRAPGDLRHADRLRVVRHLRDGAAAVPGIARRLGRCRPIGVGGDFPLIFRENNSKSNNFNAKICVFTISQRFLGILRISSPTSYVHA